MNDKNSIYGNTGFFCTGITTIIKDGYEVIGVVTQPDRPVGRKRILTPPPVKVEALKHDIPCFSQKKFVKKRIEKVLLEAGFNCDGCVWTNFTKRNFRST